VNRSNKLAVITGAIEHWRGACVIGLGKRGSELRH
jgi:hypothetical protein